MTRECPSCGTLNDTFVNPHTCWNCGEPWPERARIGASQLTASRDTRRASE